MKLKNKILFTFLITLICAFSVVGQTKTANRSNNLKTAINQYVAKNIKYLNVVGGMGRYRVKTQNTFFSDVDSDGDFDAVFEIIFCEYSSCHPTTQSSKLAIFLNSKNVYRFIADKEFTLFGKINWIDGNKIGIDIYSLDQDDPQCCPTLKEYEKYEFRKNRLVQIKNKSK